MEVRGSIGVCAARGRGGNAASKLGGPHTQVHIVGVEALRQPDQSTRRTLLGMQNLVPAARTAHGILGLLLEPARGNATMEPARGNATVEEGEEILQGFICPECHKACESAAQLEASTIMHALQHSVMQHLLIQLDTRRRSIITVRTERCPKAG